MTFADEEGRGDYCEENRGLEFVFSKTYISINISEFSFLVMALLMSRVPIRRLWMVKKQRLRSWKRNGFTMKWLYKEENN